MASRNNHRREGTKIGGDHEDLPEERHQRRLYGYGRRFLRTEPEIYLLSSSCGAGSLLTVCSHCPDLTFLCLGWGWASGNRGCGM
ncbi:hypothetical protein IG631_03057 [Alternaria alternata]|nr:hypothetical protein IG631_03057 [Alternaria alternata]